MRRMPELPEVETVRRGLAPAMEGARLARSKCADRDLRWPLAKDFDQRLTGARSNGSTGVRNTCWRDCRRATCW